MQEGRPLKVTFSPPCPPVRVGLGCETVDITHFLIAGWTPAFVLEASEGTVVCMTMS